MTATTRTSHHPLVESIEIKGQRLDTYMDGYMVDRTLWTPEIAEVIAERDGIHLTKRHWEVLHFLRDYYAEFMISPNVRILAKHLRERWGDDRFDRDELYRLFPKGPAFQGTKIAGLPKPYDCIDG